MSYSVYPGKAILARYHGWLPTSRQAYESFFSQLDDEVSKGKGIFYEEGHKPAVAAFEKAINDDKVMRALFDQIYVQAGPENPTKDFDDLLYKLDVIISNPPGYVGGLIGVPIFLLFDLLSNTAAAYDLFRMTAFNNAMKALLNSWGEYLKSTESTTTLVDTDKGWFSYPALEAMEQNRGDFDATYKCEPEKPHRGFTSWDDFFVREVKDSARPMPSDPSIIVSACESAVLRIARKVQLHDQFWLKGEKYSLYDMFNKDEATAKTFVGGTVYQAYLSPLDYHRWRSPVAGKIVKKEIVSGTYYAVLPDDGAGPNDPDFQPGTPHGALVRSQPWLTMAATRAIITIDTGNPKIGLVGFIAVGMCEVSTCEVTVKEQEVVKKGQQLGMFHFGGSNHAVIFGPEAKIKFDTAIEDAAGKVHVDKHIKVLSALAHVVQ